MSDIRDEHDPKEPTLSHIPQVNNESHETNEDVEELVGEPEDLTARKRRQWRNLGLLLVICTTASLAWIVWEQWHPTAKNEPATTNSDPDLIKRLDKNSGKWKMPDLVGKQNYAADYAKQLEEDLNKQKNQNATLQNSMAQIADEMKNVAETVKKMQESKEADTQDLQVRLEAMDAAIQDAQKKGEANAQTNNHPGINATSNIPTPTDLPQPAPATYGATSRNGASQPAYADAPAKKKPALKTTAFQLSPGRSGLPGKPIGERYLPPGSYAPGRIIIGARVSASVDAQKDPRPLLIRLDGQAVAGMDKRGNKFYVNVIGCQVQAAAYGDESAEIAPARIHNITCTYSDGRSVTAKANGFLASRGQYGIRGEIVRREGALIQNALWAGALGASGDVATGVQDAQSNNNWGTGKSYTGTNAITELAGGALTNSGTVMQRYYIKRLEQIQPVIPVKTGTPVEVVFFTPVDLTGAAETKNAPAQAQQPGIAAINTTAQYSTAANQQAAINPAQALAQQVISQAQINQTSQQQVDDPTKTDWNQNLWE